MPARFRSWDESMTMGMEEGRRGRSVLSIRNGEGLQHAFCCRVKDETGELNLEVGGERKELS